MPQLTPASLMPSSGGVGGRQADDLVHQAGHILVHIDAQELQVHRGDGGMAAFVGLGKDQHGVGLGEVVVAGKEGIPVFGGGRKGGAADLGAVMFRFTTPWVMLSVMN